MKHWSRTIGIAVCVVLSIACVNQSRTVAHLQRTMESLAVPPDAILLDSILGTDSRAHEQRCWSNHLINAYAIDTMSADEVLTWFRRTLPGNAWTPGPNETDGLRLSSPDQVRLEVYFGSLMVFPKISVKDEELKHKTVFFVSLVQFIDPSATMAACT